MADQNAGKLIVTWKFILLHNSTVNKIKSFSVRYHLYVLSGHYAFEVTQKNAEALTAGMNNRELGATKNYHDNLPAPEAIGPCTPIRAGGGNFTYFNNGQGNNIAHGYTT